ncbi:MAG: amino acid ABC transporter permease [Oscillospiraceae bacterium]|nr:amino acid ABC transporter permease [Oscillospiraceae bacterium]
MPFDISFVPGYFVRLLAYLPQTLWVVAASLLFGFALAIPLTYARYYRVRGVRIACEGFVSFIRGTPPVIQLLVVYYALTRLLLSMKVENGEFICAVIALGINSGGFFSEALLAALSGVPVGQTEAGYSVGMTRPRLMTRIILPIALPGALPNILNICFTILKESALVFYIGVPSVMSAAKLISSSHFRIVEAYIAAAMIYIPICALAEALGSLLQKRLRRHVREVA